VDGLTITLSDNVAMKQAALASGQPVKVETREGKRVLVLNLEVADVVILR
jgi:hypothetical protein